MPATDRREYFTAYQRELRQRKKRVDILFDKEDFATLERAARRHGYGRKTGAFIRDAALAYLHREYIVPDQDAIRQLELGIRRIGNNLNQIARKANTVGIEPSDLDAIREHLATLEHEVSTALRNPSERDISEAAD